MKEAEELVQKALESGTGGVDSRVDRACRSGQEVWRVELEVVGFDVRELGQEGMPA